MKTIILSLFAILLGSTGVAPAEEGTKPAVAIEQATVEQKLGQGALAQLRNDYEEGRYDPFLREIDTSYEKVQEENKLTGLANFRQGKMTDQKWADAANLLLIERNKQLVEVVAGNESLFAQQVRSASADLTTPEQAQALLRMANLRQMAPGTGKNSDENALIDLDLEYEFKSIHLDMPVIDGQPAPDRREKHYILKMEMADKMLSSAQSFQDAALKKDVELYAQNIDGRMAQNWDQYDLTLMAKGKTKPADKVQEKVVSVLQNHQEKMGDLTKQYLTKE
jgi:hypothetical protein